MAAESLSSFDNGLWLRLPSVRVAAYGGRRTCAGSHYRQE